MAKTSEYEYAVSTLVPKAGYHMEQWLVFDILVLESLVHVQVKGTAYF